MGTHDLRTGSHSHTQTLPPSEVRGRWRAEFSDAKVQPWGLKSWQALAGSGQSSRPGKEARWRADVEDYSEFLICQKGTKHEACLCVSKETQL